MNQAQSTYLDILRGLAAQLVVVGHIYSMYWNPTHTLGLGDLGVIIFFILSGFLITYTTLIKRERRGYTGYQYFSDRFFRIFVPYIPAVLLIVVLDAFVNNSNDGSVYAEFYTVKDFVATISMHQQHPVGLAFDKVFHIDQLKLTTFGSGRPLWTVANEWWLYIVFGLLLFFPKNKKKWTLAIVAVLIASIVPLFNTVAGTGAGLSLIWFLMSGVAFYYVFNKTTLTTSISKLLKGSANKSIVSILISCIFILMVFRIVWVSYVEPGFVFERPEFYDFNFYILITLFLAMVYVALGSVEVKERNSICKFVADYSYSLYLVHYTWIFFVLGMGFITTDTIGGGALLFITSNIVGLLFWLLFERHFKRVQTFFESRILKKGGAH